MGKNGLEDWVGCARICGMYDYETTSARALRDKRARTTRDGRMKFLDVALEHGPEGTRSSLSILKLLCMTVFGDRRCPADNCLHTVTENSPLCEHFLQNHTDLPPEITPNFLTNSIIAIGTDSEQFLIILPLGLSIVKSFPF